MVSASNQALGYSTWVVKDEPTSSFLFAGLVLALFDCIVGRWMWIDEGRMEEIWVG